MNYRYLVSFIKLSEKHSRLSLCHSNLLILPLLFFSPSILRIRMIRRLADVLPHLFEDSRRLVQGFRVEQGLPVIFQRILLVVEAECQSEDNIQGGRIVVMTARVPIERLLVQFTAVRLGACKGSTTNRDES